MAAAQCRIKSITPSFSRLPVALFILRMIPLESTCAACIRRMKAEIHSDIALSVCDPSQSRLYRRKSGQNVSDLTYCSLEAG